MSDPADLIGALITYLKANAALATLVGAKVFGGEVPAKEVVNMPQKCVILNAAGGGMIGRGYQDYGDRRIDTHCYGATIHDSETVHLAVRAALKTLTRVKANGVLIHWARLSSDGAGGHDPITDWPLTLASYQVLAGDTANA